MSKFLMVASMCAIVLIGTSPASAVLYEVGAAKPYATIQAAVTQAAADTDVGASGHNTPPADPVEIRVYAGTYPEVVSVPADSTIGYNGLNDSWLIHANPGDKVVVQGGFNMGLDRDNCTFQGFDVEVTTTSSGFYFNQTARSNWIKDTIIYGAGGGAAIAGSSLHGWNKLDHVTVYGTTYGISYGYASSTSATNTIVANVVNDEHYSSDSSPYSYSDLWGTHTGATDNGNNVNWPNGLDPLFASTNPADPDFLWLSAASPASGTGSSVGLIWQRWICSSRRARSVDGTCNVDSESALS